MVKKKKKVTFTKTPDKYRCIKMPLEQILKDKDTQTKAIFDCVDRTNRIVIKGYQLLRLWILDKYHKGEVIPKINKTRILECLNSFQKYVSGPKSNCKEFNGLFDFSLEDGKHLSQILSYFATEMITGIENNIKAHFVDYIKRFVNAFFRKKYEKEIENDSEFKKQLGKELKKVKYDILNNTTTCLSKYHKWLTINRHKIVPKEYKESYYYDIKCTPQKYLPYMIWMNLELEKIDAKMYQFLPLRTDIVPKNIQFDTKSIIELFVEGKKKYLDNISLYQNELWKKFFNIDLTMKDYEFDNCIITDGYSVSVRFIHKDYIPEKEAEKEKKRIGRKLTKEEKEALKKKREEEKKLKPKKKPVKKEQVEYVEFPYIDEVPKEWIEGKRIYIDPDLYRFSHLKEIQV